MCLQEVGAFGTDPAPTTTTHDPPSCSPNLGGSVADPDHDNPSFSILDPSDFSHSPSLTLALLLEAWPVNSYPYVVQLPSGSVFVAAGTLANPPGCTPPATFLHTSTCPLLIALANHPCREPFLITLASGCLSVCPHICASCMTCTDKSLSASSSAQRPCC